MNKFEFNIKSVEGYFSDLTPGEKGCTSMKTAACIEYVMDHILDLMEEEEQETISLIELVNYIADAIDDFEGDL